METVGNNPNKNKIMVNLNIFSLSFSRMNDLERTSTHIHDKISSLQQLLDLSGATSATRTRNFFHSCCRCFLRSPGAEKLFQFWPLAGAAW